MSCFYGRCRPTKTLAAELEDRDYYTADNVFWVPEGARWEDLRSTRQAARHWQTH